MVTSSRKLTASSGLLKSCATVTAILARLSWLRRCANPEMKFLYQQALFSAQCTSLCLAGFAEARV